MLETVFGLKYWQWIGLLLLIFTGIVLDFLVRLWIRIVSIRVIARRGGEARDETLKKMVRPFGLAAMALFWLWVIRALDLPPEALLVLMPAVRLFMILAVVWALFRVTDLAGEVAASKAALTDTKFDDLLIPLVRKTVKIFITVFGLIYIADSLHISIVPLLTGLGIGGVGFAFAAKDTLENLFGSVTVIADRPFQVGDWVAINDTEGIVEEVGFRSTRVRTFYNSLVTIPNGNLVRAVVDNYGRRKYRRWSTHITITYDTKPDTIEAFCEGIRELIRLHPYTRKDYYQVWLHQFGAHSLDVLVYVFWEVPDWQTELRERHRLMSDIIRLADRLGVEFAFPTQTLHVYEEQPGDEHTPEPPPEMAADFRAMRAGREAVRQITSSASWRERKPGPYRFKYAGDTEREDTDDNGTQIESRTGGDA
jgi:MscS family membrane protein